MFASRQSRVCSQLSISPSPWLRHPYHRLQRVLSLLRATKVVRINIYIYPFALSSLPCSTQMHPHSSNRTIPQNPAASSPSSSAICGSLDPPSRSKKAKSGWRYIQLTETHDELRVRPPPTSTGPILTNSDASLWLSVGPTTAPTRRNLCQYAKG